MSDPAFKDIWSELETQVPQSDGQLMRRIAPRSRWDFWIGVQQPGLHRCALMTLGTAVLPPVHELPRCRGIDVRESPAPREMDNVARTLELRLENPAYIDVFDVLIRDVIDITAGKTDEQRALDAVLQRLFRWQTFLERVPPEGLPPEAQRGLYGELLFIRDELLPAVGTKDGLSAWCGPKRKPQDFQFRRWAVEVKVSTSKHPQTMRITSELQLDDTGLDSLFLVQISLKEQIGGDETLPSIVAEIRARAAEAGEIVALENLLFDAGYHDSHAERYSNTGYFVRDVHRYRVADCFPRIIEKDLRSGVGNVSYTIGVADCHPFLIDKMELTASLKAEL